MSFTTDKNHNLTASSGLTARQLLGLGDNDARNNPRIDNIEDPLPSHAAYVHSTNRPACCEDTRRKLDLDASIHESDVGSSSMPPIPPPTHQLNNGCSQGYRPEPNPTKILNQLQRMLEDGEDKTDPSPSGPDNQPESHRSFDREAWLNNRPTIADLTTALNTPLPRLPSPPIPRPKTYNPLTEFCLRHNPLCWPCSDARDKLPALEVFLNQIVDSNKPRYQELELLDENGKVPERQVWMSSCPVMVCDVCCGCLKPWRWGEGCWWAHWWVWVKVGGDGRVRALMPGYEGV